jgi:hypothetical protein
MNTAIGRGAVVVLLVLVTACQSSGPVSPTGTTPPSAPQPPPPPRMEFPPLSGPSRTFTFERELSYPVRDFTWNSRFVLYDNGAFELQYPPSQYGPGLFRGAYQVANGDIMFLFEFSGPQRRQPMG